MKHSFTFNVVLVGDHYSQSAGRYSQLVCEWYEMFAPEAEELFEWTNLSVKHLEGNIFEATFDADKFNQQDPWDFMSIDDDCNYPLKINGEPFTVTGHLLSI
jgi:hypothetical protein